MSTGGSEVEQAQDALWHAEMEWHKDRLGLGPTLDVMTAARKTLIAVVRSAALEEAAQKAAAVLQRRRGTQTTSYADEQAVCAAIRALATKEGSSR